MHLSDLLSILIPIAHAQEAAHEAAANPSVAAMFGLDWKLFLAQLINFAVVLFVLWKWVFTPVTKGLTERANKIDASLAEAKRIAEEKQTFGSWKDAEIGKVRQEASVIIGQAKTEAESLKGKILQETKDEQQRVVEQAKTQLENEKTKAVSDIKGEIADIVVAATEKIIHEKLTAPKDQELVRETLKNVKV
jgi:F-type H+-transporting ATPase subunit b